MLIVFVNLCKAVKNQGDICLPHPMLFALKNVIHQGGPRAREKKCLAHAELQIISMKIQT